LTPSSEWSEFDVYERNLVRFLTAAAVLGFFIWAAIIAGVGLGAKALSADWLTATVRSHHMERGKGYEEQNMGLGVETDVSQRIRLALGFYRNSERRDSLYGAVVYCPVSVRWGNWRGCGMAGAVTGYNDTVAPLAGAVLSYEGREWGMNLLLLPNKKGDLTEGVAALQIKRRF
jgi:hypothetical protein